MRCQELSFTFHKNFKPGLNFQEQGKVVEAYIFRRFSYREEISKKSPLSQGLNFNECFRVSEVAQQKLFIRGLFPFFSKSSWPMVMVPVNSTVEIHCTTVFALRNGKLSRWGEWLTPIPP